MIILSDKGLVGKRFNSLVILDIYRENKRTFAKCKCDCGNIKDINLSNIKRGLSKSCGCSQRRKEGSDSYLFEKPIGKLTVIKFHHKDDHYIRHYLCKCECGNYKVIAENHLKDGTTKSCGCYQVEARITCKNMTGTRFHNIWRSMKQRCYDKNCSAYHHYGGRGITICKDWLDFNNFYNDMYQSYLNHVEEFGEKQTTIDRIDVNGDYEPSNCRWATMEEQAKNKRRVIRVYDEILGEENSLLGYCKTHNLKYERVAERVRSGWSIEDAITKPPRMTTQTKE